MAKAAARLVFINILSDLAGAPSAFLPQIWLRPESLYRCRRHAFSSTHYQPLVEAIEDAENHNLSEAQRIFHGRGGCYPGFEHLTLDWLPPVWVLTSFRELAKEDLTLISNILEAKWESLSSKVIDEEGIEANSLTWVFQSRCLNNVTTAVMTGKLPDPHVVQEEGCQYLVQASPKSSSGGRNMGIFLDMQNGRKWMQENAQNKKVLNLFAYTCGFSVTALKGGAREVVNLDMAQGAVKVGQRNHELNGFESGARFLGHNVFKSFGKIKKLGPYDIIVADPPSYQKGSFVAKKDYIKLIRRLPDLLLANHGGKVASYVLLCLNAPELDSNFLRQQVAEAAPELCFVRRLENPSSFPVVDPERALKVLLYKLPPKGS